MDPFIGEIRLLPFTFAPQGWAFCDGQLLPVQTNTALFAIIGTIYGGNGTTNFALPDLQGRAVPGVGSGPGLQNWQLGMADGENAVTLLESQMPAHNHQLSGLDVVGNAHAPANDKFLARDGRGGQGTIRYLAPSGEPLTARLAIQTLMASGSSQAHENRQPFLSLNFCIALEGMFPMRN